jgi:nucleoside-diphosphate kinase
MALELTFSIIKPDAVAKNHIGEILARFEKNGLRIVAAKLLTLTRQQAEAVYGIHEGRPFYSDLLQFMCSGPSVALVLEGENAVARARDVMGLTNPAEAAPGTIRADFGAATNRNAVHGSDAPDTARYEMSCIFEPNEIYSQADLASSERRYQSAGS